MYRVIISLALVLVIAVTLFFLLPRRPTSSSIEDQALYAAKSLVFWPTIAIIASIFLAATFIMWR